MQPVTDNLTELNISSPDEEQLRNPVENAFIAIVVLVIMLFSLIGNTSVVVAICNYRHLRREQSNLLIINLSVTDACTALFVMLSSFSSLVTNSWVLGAVFCDLVCAINYCCMIVSMITLCFISLDRFYAIIHALSYNSKMTRKHIYLMIFYSWFQGIIFSSIPVIYNWVDYDYWEIICAIQWHKERIQAVYYVIAAFTCCFLIPGIVLLFCYCRISYEASKVGVQPPIPSGTYSKQKYGTSSKAVRSLMIVVLAYFIFLTPFCVTKLVKVIVIEENFIPGYLNTISSIFQYCSSAINPLIYGIFRKDFRKAYKYIFHKLAKNKEDRNFSLSNTLDFGTSVPISESKF